MSDIRKEQLKVEESLAFLWGTGGGAGQNPLLKRRDFRQEPHVTGFSIPAAVF